MIHDQNNNQIWIVGGIEPESKKESFDIINMEVGTLAKKNGWRVYDFFGQ